MGPTEVCCSVEVPVRALHQSSLWGDAISAAEVVQGRQHASRRDSEHRAIVMAVGPARRSSAVKVPITGLDQATVDAGAVGAPNV